MHNYANQTYLHQGCNQHLFSWFCRGVISETPGIRGKIASAFPEGKVSLSDMTRATPTLRVWDPFTLSAYLVLSAMSWTPLKDPRILLPLFTPEQTVWSRSQYAHNKVGEKLITTWSRSHSSLHVQDSAKPTTSVWIQLLREAATAQPRLTQRWTFSAERILISAAVCGHENNVTALIWDVIAARNK